MSSLVLFVRKNSLNFTLALICCDYWNQLINNSVHFPERLIIRISRRFDRKGGEPGTFIVPELLNTFFSHISLNSGMRISLFLFIYCINTAGTFSLNFSLFNNNIGLHPGSVVIR
jgi:hypothetical protein